MASPTDPPKDTSHHGSCHCKAIQFDFLAPQNINVSICNCSICTMKGFEHLIIPKEKFTLSTTWDAVKTYTFGTGIAQHYFCGTCGISPFYVPRSNPNGYSVNFRCVNQESFEDIKWDAFDGKNWEAAFRRSDIGKRA